MKMHFFGEHVCGVCIILLMLEVFFGAFGV